MALLPVLPVHDIHEKIVEEAIEAVLSTVDLQAVLERAGRLLNDRFGTTRVAIHRVFPDAPGRAQVALVSDPRHLGDDDRRRNMAAAGFAATPARWRARR